MKRAIALTLLIVGSGLQFVVFGQNLPMQKTVTLPDERIWQWTHSATFDGGSIIAAQVSDTNLNNPVQWGSVLFIKLSASAAIEWSTQIDSMLSSGWINNIVQSPDSSYYCCFVESEFQPFYRSVKLDPDGNVIFNHRINLPSNGTQFMVPASFAKNDGTYLISGSFSDSSSVGTTILFQLDASGSVMWSKSVSLGQFYTSPQLDTFQNGDILFMGVRSVSQYATGPCVMRLDPSGNFISARTIADSFPNFPLAFKLLPDDHILILGKTYGPNWDNRKLTLTLCNDTAEVIWARCWGNWNMYLEPEDLEADSNGIYVTGNTELYDGFFFRFDSSGLNLVTKKYDGVIMMSLAPHADSGLTVLNYRAGNMHIMYTDFTALGCEHWPMSLQPHPFDPASYTTTCTTSTFPITTSVIPLFQSTRQVTLTDACIYSGINEPVEEQLLLFPNPAMDELTLQGRQIISLVEISNVHGEIIYRAEPDSVVCTIDVSGFDSGVFIVNVVTENTYSNAKLIVTH